MRSLQTEDVVSRCTCSSFVLTARMNCGWGGGKKTLSKSSSLDVVEAIGVHQYTETHQVNFDTVVSPDSVLSPDSQILYYPSSQRDQNKVLKTKQEVC